MEYAKSLESWLFWPTLENLIWIKIVKWGFNLLGFHFLSIFTEIKWAFFLIYIEKLKVNRRNHLRNIYLNVFDKKKCAWTEQFLWSNFFLDLCVCVYVSWPRQTNQDLAWEIVNSLRSWSHLGLGRDFTHLRWVKASSVSNWLESNESIYCIITSQNRIDSVWAKTLNHDKHKCIFLPC